MLLEVVRELSEFGKQIILPAQFDLWDRIKLSGFHMVGGKPSSFSPKMKLILV